LEPIQTAESLEGQVDELRAILEEKAAVPVILIGYSWGAWLSFIVTAQYQALAKKLILIGSGPFEEKYVSGLHDARSNRLNLEGRIEFEAIFKALGEPINQDKTTLFDRLGNLVTKADTYDPIPVETDETSLVDRNGDIYQSVWGAAAELRRSGELLALGKSIQCPVIAIHGDYDPHPAEGVQKPLSSVLRDFRFVLLEKCGHTPWLERQARESFYHILKEEIEFI
jgi:pimeloyl-ACP methyl ester carboxylesterase